MWLRRLICTFVGRIWHKQVFSWRGSYYKGGLLFIIWLGNSNEYPQHMFLWRTVGKKSFYYRQMPSLSVSLDWSVCYKSRVSTLTVQPVEPHHEKTCLCHMRTIKAQVSLRICTVWSASFVCCLDRIIPLVSIAEISSLYLASVTAQAGLSLTWSQTPEDRFSRDGAQLDECWSSTVCQMS